MLTEYNQFSSFICQKVLPLVYDESLSYYEVLTKLSNYVNEMIESVNATIREHNNLATDYEETITQLNSLKTEVLDLKNKGYFIADNSIQISKLSELCLKQIQEYTVNTINSLAKFVYFGLNDDGYFIANIPKSWTQIIFGTDNNGNLTLKY